jgi:hypothetical protein
MYNKHEAKQTNFQKLKLNSSANPKIKNLISIEMSREDSINKEIALDHCPSIEISELLSSKHESNSKVSKERGRQLMRFQPQICKAKGK